MSTPAKWENFRLAKIKRMSGGGTAGEDGVLRLIFVANQEGSAVDVAIFSADFTIESTLTYQRARLTVVDSAEESIVIDPGESETVNGFITFRTLNRINPIVQTFYELLQPGDTADSDSDGFYDVPAVYNLVNTAPGGSGVSSDFAFVGYVYGTGMLVDSTNNAIPQTDSDVQSWITAFNYPFDLNANRTSSTATSIRIPTGLFQEFNITAPAGDQPTNDISGTFYPVWINRIALTGSGNEQMRLYFATYTISDTQPSLLPIEFARLDLTEVMIPGQIVEIAPIDDLLMHVGSDDELFQQHFGRGHVVLSSKWGGTSTEVSGFFASLEIIVGNEAEFTQQATRLSSFGISRVPKYIPTIGQSRALSGTSSRLDIPIPPSEDNLYVSELDQGLGNRKDLESSTDIDPHEAVSRFGYSGALAHKIIQLCIDNTKIPTGTETGAGAFYEEHVLPRLRLLLGRNPSFGDFWHDGTNLFFFNGDTWQTS